MYTESIMYTVYSVESVRRATSPPSERGGWMRWKLRAFRAAGLIVSGKLRHVLLSAMPLNLSEVLYCEIKYAMMCYYTFNLYYYYRFINLIEKGSQIGNAPFIPNIA